MIFATCGNVLTIIALLGPMSSAVIGRVRQRRDVQACRALQEGAVRAVGGERRSPDKCYALPVSNAAIRKYERTNRSCFQAVTQSFITPTCSLLKMRALISGWLCLFCSTIAAAAFSSSCIQDISWIIFFFFLANSTTLFSVLTWKTSRIQKHLTAFWASNLEPSPLHCFHASSCQDTIKSLKICSVLLQRLYLDCNSLASTAVHSMSH